MSRHLVRTWLFLFTLLTTVVAARVGQAEHPSSESLRARVDAIADPFVVGKPYVAAVVGLIQNGQHHVFGYGAISPVSAPAPPDGDTLFEIGSITKAFTGTLLAIAVDRWEVALDDAAADHLPAELRPPIRGDQPITLLDLATHHSGLPVQPPEIPIVALGSGTVDNPYSKYGHDQLALSLSKYVKLDRDEPRFAYSNLGVGLLGEALVHASGAESFERLVTDRILGPINAADSCVVLTDVLKKRLAPGHDAQGDEVSNWDFACLQACGALRSTARDMLRFADASLGAGPRSLAALIKDAQSPRRTVAGSPTRVGLCWLTTPLRALLGRAKTEAALGAGVLVHWHNGGTGGYRSFLAISRKHRAAVVVLSNSTHSVDVMGAAILQMLIQGATTAPSKEAETRPATVSPTSREAKWWQDRHAAMNKRVAEGNVDLVFIGDSITQSWEGGGKDVWREFYGKRNAVNLGISGDRTQHVLWRLQNGNLRGISPKLAVVMIGTNNAGSDSSEDIAEGVHQIVKTLRAKLPKTKVLLLAIFPRGPTPDDRLRKVNARATAIFSKLADGKSIHFLDIGPKFLTEDGVLKKEVMPDLLHLTPGSYRAWAEAIEPTVKKLLAEE